MTQTPASPALTEADQAMREEIAAAVCLAFYHDDAWSRLSERAREHPTGQIAISVARCRKAADRLLTTIRARATAAEEERDKLKTDLEDCAELVGQYASAEAPEGMETLAKDRDRWFDLATAAEATLREREAEIERLKIAFHDAIRRPLGVTPDSGAEFYEPRMADEAEARRAASNRSRHRYRANRKYPWFCEDCGYPEHEALKHLQPGEATR